MWYIFSFSYCLYLFHKAVGSGGCFGEEFAVTCVFFVVLLDKIADVDLVLPSAAFKTCPILMFHLFFLLLIDENAFFKEKDKFLRLLLSLYSINRFLSRYCVSSVSFAET
jgi:hypothetical protein